MLFLEQSGLLEWRIVFWITLAIFAITNLVFVLTASGEVQYWNNMSNCKPRKQNGIPNEGNLFICYDYMQ